MAGAELTRHLAALDSKATELSADDRLRILHDFYRNGEENFYHFSLADSMRLGHSFKDYILLFWIESNDLERRGAIIFIRIP